MPNARTLIITILAGLLLALSGCGGPRPIPELPAECRQILQAADAWCAEQGEPDPEWVNRAGCDLPCYRKGCETADFLAFCDEASDWATMMSPAPAKPGN